MITEILQKFIDEVLFNSDLFYPPEIKDDLQFRRARPIREKLVELVKELYTFENMYLTSKSESLKIKLDNTVLLEELAGTKEKLQVKEQFIRDMEIHRINQSLQQKSAK